MGFDGGKRDDPDNIIDASLRGLARGLEGLRGFVTQIADPTAAPPKPVGGNTRRPPREAPRSLPANRAGAREPAVDVYDEGALIRVVAHMPGADPDTLQVRGEGNRLVIGAAGPARRYERTLLLPARVLPEGVTPSFINGVLEVLLPAVREASPPAPPLQASVPLATEEAAPVRREDLADGRDTTGTGTGTSNGAA